MSSSRAVLRPFKSINNVTPIVGDLVGASTDVTALDSFIITVTATAGTTGSPRVETNATYQSADEPGVWVPLPFSPTAADGLDPAGTVYTFDVQVGGFRSMRAVWAGTNTAGKVTAVIEGKGA